MAKQDGRERGELEAQVKYLQTQLAQLMKERRRWMRGPNSPGEREEPLEAREEEMRQASSSSEDGDEVGSPRDGGPSLSMINSSIKTKIKL